MTGSAEPPRSRVGAQIACGALLWLVAGCGGAAVEPTAVEPPSVRRIVALSPHLAELVFAAGAGSRLVGVVSYSDHPPEARRITRVGDAFRIDAEAIALLAPDLILGWPSGNSQAVLDGLSRAGYRVIGFEPRLLDDVTGQLRRIGSLAGTRQAADAAASDYQMALDGLRQRYRGSPAVRVFYQIAPEPLVTVGRDQFIDQAIALCGGINVFHELPVLAPVVDVESVIAAMPEVIIANGFNPGTGTADDSPLARWERWPHLPAVAAGNLRLIAPDMLSVPGPRLPAAVGWLCEVLDDARQRLGDQN